MIKLQYKILYNDNVSKLISFFNVPTFHLFNQALSLSESCRKTRRPHYICSIIDLQRKERDSMLGEDLHGAIQVIRNGESNWCVTFLWESFNASNIKLDAYTLCQVLNTLTNSLCILLCFLVEFEYSFTAVFCGVRFITCKVPNACYKIPVHMITRCGWSWKHSWSAYQEKKSEKS